MPGQGAIRAGRAFVELFADDSKLVRGLKRAQAKLRAFGNSVRNIGLQLAGIGTAVAAPFVAASQVFAKIGDSVAKMARRTGFAVESLSELSLAAELSGSGIEALENGVRRMQRTIYDAGRGLSTATDALGDLGLTLADVAGLNPEQQFKLLADRLSGIDDPTRMAAIAMTIFGRSGTALLPMLENGAAGIEEMQRQARALGLTISSEDAKAAEDFTDVLSIMWRVLKQNVFVIGSALAPVLTDVAKWVTKASVQVAAWIKQNKGLVVTIFKVAVGVAGLGVALVVVGTAITGLAALFGALASIAGAVSAAMAGVLAALGALLSPIGLLSMAIVGLGAVVIRETGLGARAVDWLAERFGSLKDDAVASYRAIADALAAGDIVGAARILWLSLKLEFTRGINYLKKAWLGFSTTVVKLGIDAFDGILAAARIVWHSLRTGWIELAAAIQKAWATITIFSVGDLQDRLAEIDKLRQDQRDKANAEDDAALARIGTRNLELNKALDKDYAEKIAENEADLLKAREEWQRAIRESRGKTADGFVGPPERRQAVLDFADELADAIGTVAEAKATARGTFNAGAIQSLMSGIVADRATKAAEKTATNTESIAKDTKKLLRTAEDGGAVFT